VILPGSSPAGWNPTPVGGAGFAGADWHMPSGLLVIRFQRGVAHLNVALDSENAYALARALFAAAFTEPTGPRRLVRVQLSNELFSSFLWQGRTFRPTRVVKGLPHGAKLIDVRRIPMLEIIEAEFEHPDFQVAGLNGPAKFMPEMENLEQWPEPPAAGGGA
jgi:hypothetical protein